MLINSVQNPNDKKYSILKFARKLTSFLTLDLFINQNIRLRFSGDANAN